MLYIFSNYDSFFAIFNLKLKFNLHRWRVCLTLTKCLVAIWQRSWLKLNIYYMWILLKTIPTFSPPSHWCGRVVISVSSWIKLYIYIYIQSHAIIRTQPIESLMETTGTTADGLCQLGWQRSFLHAWLKSIYSKCCLCLQVEWQRSFSIHEWISFRVQTISGNSQRLHMT